MIRKVIIINPANLGRESLRPPFGLLMITSIFKRNGSSIVWIDADLSKSDPGRAERLIESNSDADLIAIGGLHTAYSYVKHLFKYLERKNIGIPVILGGRIAQTLDYLLWRKISNLKLLCKQDGEHVVESLCRHFPDIERVPGVHYRKNGNIIKNPVAPVINSLDELPPMPWDVLDRRYFANGKGYILTGRGCPFACNFCRDPKLNPDKYRTMSISRVIGEMEYLINKHRLHTIQIVDEFFLQDKDRVSEFCEGVKKLNIRWHCSSRADGIKSTDLNLLRKMREAGCRSILMGIESASDTILRNMNKKMRISTIEDAVEMIRSAGMKVKGSFIFGYPGETWETAMKTVDWRIKTDLRTRSFYATPYPGTKLYEYFKERYQLNLDDEEEWIIKSPGLKDLQVNLTDLSMEELRKLDKACNEKLLGKYWRWKNIYRRHRLKLIHAYLQFRKRVNLNVR